MPQVIQTYYDPRDKFESFHARVQRWACIVFHRRGGKTVACVNDIHARALYTQKKNARYAYIAPYYRQAKDIAWMYLKEATVDSAVKVKESELSVELFNGAKISLYGADNPDALRGIYLDGVVLDEFGDCRPSLWAEVILPTLSDRKGWATFIGTPKGKNHFFQIREIARRTPEEWYYLECKASETGYLPDEELRMAEKLMDADQFAQEYMCSFDAAVKGTYYSHLIAQMEKGRIDDAEAPPQIGIVQHDDDLPTDVALDLGFTDSTALWFWQQRVDGVAVIDYDEDHSQPLNYYLDLLRAKPYKIRTLYLPHDAKAKTLQTGRSTIEQVQAYIERLELPWEIEIVPRLDLQDGIDAVRYVLPFCYMDLDKCFNGIEALRAYKRNYNEVTKSFSDRPNHDWSSHGSDAFRQLAIVTKERLAGKSIMQTLSESTSSYLGTHYPIGLNTLFSDREKRVVAWRRSNRI